MRSRWSLLLATLLASACAAPPADPGQRAAQQCRTYRNMMTQDPPAAQEACARQLGAPYCQQCLYE